jgi:signal transduction histidine kinase
VALAALLLSFLVASITLRFMRRLAVASRAFSSDIASAPIPETGPRDVRETFAAFNQMQQRIREAMQERAQILAAISHDLQTPLTACACGSISCRTKALGPACSTTSRPCNAW